MNDVLKVIRKLRSENKSLRKRVRDLEMVCNIYDKERVPFYLKQAIENYVCSEVEREMERERKAGRI